MTAAELADTSDPRFTDDQRATLARFEAAPTPPEIVEARIVEEVARAIHDTEYQPCRDGYDDCQMADHYRRLAAAAVAAYRAAQDGGAEEALRRVEALAEELDTSATEASRRRTPASRAIALADASAAGRIRAALATVDGER